MLKTPLIATAAFLFACLFCKAAAPVSFDWFKYSGNDAVFSSPPAEGQFQNPIISGFYPDPSICRVGGDFYLVHSTFAFYPGVPIFHSTDLVNWKQIGHVLDRPEQLDIEGLEVSQAIFAPTIRHYEGVFYMITTSVYGINNFYVTATDPAGPWSEPKVLPWIDGIDPSFFFDDDGRVYITHNGPPPENDSLYEGHRAVWLWEIDLETNQPIDEGKIVINGGVDLSEKPVWIEAPHIFKKDGWYYLTCAEGGTSVNHSQVIFRSKTVDGEWVPWDKNPILTQRDLPADRENPIVAAGHADFVKLPNGEWWATFLAIRTYGEGFYNTGRETFLLPVEWTEDGWPMMLEPGLEIPWQADAPDLPNANGDAPPTTGNFTWSDEFDDPKLGYEWAMLRTPSGDWFEVGDGSLKIVPKSDSLYEKGNPSWLARRQQHHSYEASTRFEVPEAGVSAGVAALIREDHHFFCGVRKVGTHYEAFLEKAENGPAEVVASKRLKGVSEGDSLILKIVAEKGDISFYVETEDGKEVAVAEKEDATILTTTKAWGFVGALMGPYARAEEE